MILNLIKSYLGKLFTFLFNKYPGLYKAMDYFFTTLSVFNLYFYSIVFKLHDRFKNNYPIFYNILLYFYSEYLSILKGNLSRNMGYFISFYVLYDINNTNLTIFTLLLLNSFVKEYLTKDTWIKINYPILHTIILDISSLVNTCLILYFLGSIWVKLVVPFIEKLLHILKMAGNENNNNNQPGSDKTPGKNPQGPENPSYSEYYINKNGKKAKRSYKKEAEDEREEAHSYMYINKNTSTPYGEGVETSYDHNYTKICKVYWKNVPVNGQLKKQIWKTEDYDKKGALTKAVLLEDGVEVGIYNHKNTYMFR